MHGGSKRAEIKEDEMLLWWKRSHNVHTTIPLWFPKIIGI
jgi:hypothetical protein